MRGKEKKKIRNLLLRHVKIQSCASGIKNMLINRVIRADFQPMLLSFNAEKIQKAQRDTRATQPAKVTRLRGPIRQTAHDIPSNAAPCCRLLGSTYKPRRGASGLLIKGSASQVGANKATGLQDFIFCRRSESGMLGRDLETRVPRGPEGRRGGLGWPRSCGWDSKLPPSPTTPPHRYVLFPFHQPPSVICTLAKRRQDSTERAAAFIFPSLAVRAGPVLSFTLSAVFKVHNMQVDLCTGQRSLQTYWDLARDFYSLHKSVPFHFAPRTSLSAPRCPWRTWQQSIVGGRGGKLKMKLSSPFCSAGHVRLLIWVWVTRIF